MTREQLQKKHNVNIIRTGYGRHDRKYHAFLGGNGTGEPVVDLAKADTLGGLDRKLAKLFPKKPS